jgi:hypothetical protein
LLEKYCPVRTGALKKLAAAHLALSSGSLIHDPAGGYISYLSAPPYQAVCVVVGRHRVPQSLKSQDSMRCRPIHGASPCLGLGLCLWPPAHCKHSRHPSRCPCNVLRPCMHPCIHAWPIAPVRGGVAWRQTPAGTLATRANFFALLRREASQNNPALLPTKKNPLRPTSTPQGKHIVISPIAPARCNAEDGRTAGRLDGEERRCL